MSLKERHIFLTGFSGSGKTTVAHILARGLRRPVRDTDCMVERAAGKSVAAIFAKDGERAFRRLEAEALARVMALSAPSVIALGGGALIRGRHRTLVKRAGILVYLSCSVRELDRRLGSASGRPIVARPGFWRRRAQRLNHLRGLLYERRPGYRSAHLTVSTTRRTPTETARMIMAKLRSRDA